MMASLVREGGSPVYKMSVHNGTQVGGCNAKFQSAVGMLKKTCVDLSLPHRRPLWTAS